MHVKIAGHDRPVRAPGALPSPIGLLPASENAKWVGMLVSFALGLILSTAHIAGSPAPFGLAFLAAMGSATLRRSALRPAHSSPPAAA